MVLGFGQGVALALGLGLGPELAVLGMIREVARFLKVPEQVAVIIQRCFMQVMVGSSVF